jgi:energy-coupling factor transport system ATP-binding protein
MDPVISIENLTFTYRGRELPALKNIAADVEEGAFIVVMGHGGAGKSTLCCSLNGLVPGFFRGQYQGRVRVKGQEVARHKVAQMSRLVGLVLQDFEAQLFSTNMELEMAFGPENLCLPHHEIELRTLRYLSFLGLNGFRNREPASLSGGQKQRLAIGSVLAMEPEVLVMDEPTTDLDPRARREILQVADRLRDWNRTLLIVDHEAETAENADQVWLMKEGAILARGRPAEVLSDASALTQCGIAAPPIVELFNSMGWPGSPLSLKDALSIIERQGLAAARRFEPPGHISENPAGSAILEAEDLHHVYPYHHFEALRGINLSIREGEFVALLGQNGSGKTTLAKHFNGLLKPASGRMLLRGKPTASYTHREMARQVGFVFQNPDHQIFANTVYEEVGFSLKVFGEDAKTMDRHVSEALDVVGLRGYEERSPSGLMKGERQRVAVASVLAAKPRVLVLDEPTTGLDDRHQRDMMGMLKDLHKRGHTIIIITHSMKVAEEYADRTVVLKEGAILLDGPTRSVFAEEERLAETSLRPSPIVQLSNRLGMRALTVKQMVDELKA